VRAFVLSAFDEPPALRDDLPEPSPSAGRVVVRVHASSVNGADAGIASGMVRDMLEHEFPVTLGRDFAGVVEQVGESGGRAAGDEVFGFVPVADPTVHDGSWAELIAVAEDRLAEKPRNVDMAQAGAAPLAAVTALGALDAIAPAEGTTVLVIGATGGVGSYFVQLAANAGAHVVAPAGAEDADYLRELGVAEVFDRDADLESAILEAYPDGVDAILDVVSFEPPASLLREDGRLASSLGAAGDGEGRANLMAVSTTENLERVAELLDGGALRVPLQASYDVAEAGEALRRFSSEHTQGKLGIRVF
jgi:NADPH2:quinone reductase